MFKMISQGHIFSPEDKGVQDILICQEKIAKIGKDLSNLGNQLGAKVIHADGKIVAPGFIDQHVHFLGAGDYEGPGRATTDIRFGSLIRSGITTAVGCLGSEDTARNLLDLVKRARDLDKLGITTYIYTGSFNIPPPTITGNVRHDLMMVDKVLGVKFTISENMAPLVSLSELADVARNSYLGGRIAGKKGLIHIHLGTRSERMGPLFELIKLIGSRGQATGPVPAGEPPPGIPITNFIPTHVNRVDPDIMEHAIKFLKMGGTVDMSAIMSPDLGSHTSISPEQALSEFVKLKIPIEQVTLSSDGNVPIPKIDSQGNKIGLCYAGVDVLYRAFLSIVRAGHIPFFDALKVVTCNVARVLGIEDRKGAIEVGKDADLIIFSKDYNISNVLARGQVLLENGRMVIQNYLE